MGFADLAFVSHIRVVTVLILPGNARCIDYRPGGQTKAQPRAATCALPPSSNSETTQLYLTTGWDTQPNDLSSPSRRSMLKADHLAANPVLS